MLLQMQLLLTFNGASRVFRCSYDSFVGSRRFGSADGQKAIGGPVGPRACPVPEYREKRFRGFHQVIE